MDAYGLGNHGIPWLYSVATENSVPGYPKIHYSQWYCEFMVIHVPHQNLHWCNKMSNTPIWSLLENTHAVIQVFQFLFGLQNGYANIHHHGDSEPTTTRYYQILGLWWLMNLLNSCGIHPGCHGNHPQVVAERNASRPWYWRIFHGNSWRFSGWGLQYLVMLVFWTVNTWWDTFWRNLQVSLSPQVSTTSQPKPKSI